MSNSEADDERINVIVLCTVPAELAGVGRRHTHDRSYGAPEERRGR